MVMILLVLVSQSINRRFVGASSIVALAVDEEQHRQQQQ